VELIFVNAGNESNADNADNVSNYGNAGTEWDCKVFIFGTVEMKKVILNRSYG